jgi:hypothetical protein
MGDLPNLWSEICSHDPTRVVIVPYGTIKEDGCGVISYEVDKRHIVV